MWNQVRLAAGNLSTLALILALVGPAWGQAKETRDATGNQPASIGSLWSSPSAPEWRRSLESGAGFSFVYNGRKVGPAVLYQSHFGGAFGAAGRIHEWSLPVKQQMRKHVDVFEKIRRFLVEDYYPLEAQPRTLQTWSGWQFHDPKTQEGFVQAFRLRARQAVRTYPLKGLDRDATYRFADPYHGKTFETTGAKLLSAGLEFSLPENSSQVWLYAKARPGSADRPPAKERPGSAQDFSKLPANEWILIHSEDDSGGKQFARAVYAGDVDRLYLWGTGGKMPARNVFLRYELESLDPTDPKWSPAFPRAMAGNWSAEDFPPFRIYGQSGPDGLKYDEGPRLQCVGGYHATNRVRWWDFDGVLRPSPIHTFNMACWDSKRRRIVYYSDGCTFALDPATNTWADLKPKNHPKTCRAVAWASMCYDPPRDRILLFGGGLATNPGGGAPTWIYDCGQNVWRRPKLHVEPPPRCNAPIVYDAARRVMIMFGGYNQAAALSDTWVFDCETDRWEQRRPKVAPPPMFAPAAAAIPGSGKVLVCGFDARKVTMHHQTSTSALKDTWVYDVAEDQWTPIHAGLSLAGYGWLTATASPRHGVILLVAFGPQRRTYALRYDPAVPPVETSGVPPGTIAWKYPEQKFSLERAPAPDRQAHAKWLASLPVNRFVDAQPPGMLISKTWSTAVIDTDRSEVIYTGGGHSGYSGNDFARYSIAQNRWSLDFPPCFPPFLESTNAGIFGWSYGMIPFSQHTYLWYCYDPLSKTVLYLARPSLFDGVNVQLGDDPDDVFSYEAKKHGYASWVYDPAEKKMHRPSFGRPFANPWHLSLAGTPEGTYAICDNRLHHGRVDGKTGHVRWRLVDAEFPEPREKIRYHYEFQPLLHDTRRDRLIQLKGDGSRVDVYARPLAEGGQWRQLETEGAAAIGREAVYIARHDTVLWLADKRLFAMDCRTNRMAELEVELPEGLYTHECALVYDPTHDVCVALIPRSFSGPMQTLLYRFDPKTAAYR